MSIWKAKPVPSRIVSKNKLPFSRAHNASRLINCLRQHTGRVYSKDEILDYIWHDRPDGGPEFAHNAIMVYVVKLRHMGYPLVSMRSRGYYYAADKTLDQILEDCPRVQCPAPCHATA